MNDEERIKWEIDAVRDAIGIDWARLASKKLTTDKRKVIREHLAMNISALRDLVERNRLASQKVKLKRNQLQPRSSDNSTPQKPNLEVKGKQ